MAFVFRSMRPRFALAALLLSLFALAGADSQCSKVADPVEAESGPLLGGGRSDCMKACTRAANEARAIERELHRDNVRACRGNPPCLQEEAARHSAAMQQIARDFQECKEDCHNQGGGGGGQ